MKYPPCCTTKVCPSCEW